MSKNTDGHDNPEKTADEKLSAELGMDGGFVEQQINFRLDLARMQRGESAELGYVFLDRQDHPDAAVVFDTHVEAEVVLDIHPLIDSLTKEDCLDVYVPDNVGRADLACREIILP